MKAELLTKWAPVVGLTLTMIGVLIAFYLPHLGHYWGWSLRAERQQFWLRVRVTTGALLVIVGTALQIYASWPT